MNSLGSTWTSIWTELVQTCERLCGHLVPVGDWIKSHLVAVPTWRVRRAMALAFIVLAIWSLLLSKEYVMEGAHHATWWNDPRRWACFLMIVLTGLYLTL